MELDARLNVAWRTLWLTLGLVPIVAGLDKFFNLLTNWEMYLNPLVPRMLHLSPAGFMHIVGVIEMVAGVLILTRWTRFAAYLVMIWLCAIALNLITQGRFLDVAVRDLVIATGAFTLAKLTEVREAGVVRESSGAVAVLQQPRDRLA